MPIVVFKDAPPRTREAAVTLADYIERISGQKPLVLLGAPSPAPDSAIWVGLQPDSPPSTAKKKRVNDLDLN